MREGFSGFFYNKRRQKKISDYKIFVKIMSSKSASCIEAALSVIQA